MTDQTNEVSGSLDSSGRIVGGAKAELSFDVLMRSSGKLGNPPDYNQLLKACGLQEIIIKPTEKGDKQYGISQGVVYKPHSGHVPSITFYYYLDKTIYKITGARGNMQLSLESGGVSKFSFNFSSQIAGFGDEQVPQVSYNMSNAPVIFKDSVVLIDGKKAAIHSLSIDMGNKLTNPDNPNAKEGFDASIITERNITGSIDPFKTLTATRNIMQDFLTGQAKPIFASIGNTDGNRVTIIIQQAMYTARNIGDREGIATEEVQFDALGQDNGVIICYH